MLEAGLPCGLEERVALVVDGKQECAVGTGQRRGEGLRLGQIAGHDLDLVWE